MVRKVFYSFHFKNDFARVQQIRNMDSINGQTLATAQQWEDAKGKGDAAVEKWIDAQMTGKSCLVVLIGSDTSNRKWVKHEIKKAWSDGKAVLGIHINKLKNLDGNTSAKGNNPFSNFTLCDGKVSMSSAVPVKTPYGTTSKETYATIKDSLESWIEEAIKARKDFRC